MKYSHNLYYPFTCALIVKAVYFVTVPLNFIFCFASGIAFLYFIAFPFEVPVNDTDVVGNELVTDFTVKTALIF